jgi:hypothetical protein
MQFVFLFLSALIALAVAKCNGGNGNAQQMAPEKRAVRSSIVFKGLLTDRHRSNDLKDDSEFVGEFWILDVYKGADKLAAQMGVMGGGGPGGLFNLRDQ